MGNEWTRYIELKQERPEYFENSKVYTIEFDSDIIKNFEKKTGKKIGVIYESSYNILVVDLVYNQAGKYFTYERLLPAVKSGAVVCVPKIQNRFILLKQYRHTLQNYQYAFPRGYADINCTAEENAKKELMEELGATATNLKCLGTIIPDSGISGGEATFFLCEIDNYAIIPGYEGIEDICIVSSYELTEMISKKEITDGFTLGAYAYLKALNLLDQKTSS